MAKLRPAGKKKKKKESNLKAVPCLLLVITGIALLTMLFFAMLQSAN
jgi:hypothetical protein